MGLVAHQSQQIGTFFKKDVESFIKLSAVTLNTAQKINGFDLISAAHKLTPLFAFFFLKTIHSFLPAHNILLIEMPSFTKVTRLFFKKILLTRPLAIKHKFRGGRYFWVFRRKGYFWRKKKLLKKRILRTWDLGVNPIFSFLVKVKILNFLKSYWSFLKKKKKHQYKFGVHDVWDENEVTSNIFEEDDEYPEFFFFKVYDFPWSKPHREANWLCLLFSQKKLLELHPKFISPLFFNQNIVFIKSLLFMFSKEMIYINFKKQFTNYYIFKTFEFAYHEFWKNNEYSRLLTEFSRFKKSFYVNYELFSNVDQMGSNDFQIFFEKRPSFFEEMTQQVFKNLGTKPIKKKKYKRRMGRIKRMKRKSFRYVKLDTLNFFLKKMSSTSNPTDTSTVVGLYNNYFHNFFFLDIPVFSQEIFENQDLINLLLTNNLNVEEQHITTSTTQLLKKRFFNSNYTPVVLLTDAIKTAVLTQKKIITQAVDHKYLQHFITGFISNVTDFKALFILNSNLNSFKNSIATDYTRTVYAITSYFTKIYKKFFKNFELPHFIEFFSFSLLKKDLNFFVKFFKKCLEEMSLKKHKKVLYSFEFLLKKFLIKFFMFTQVRGLKFEITGKISVTGNSKTRNKIIKYGYYSLTNKSLRIEYLYDTIRTTTGVLGFRMYITY